MLGPSGGNFNIAQMALGRICRVFHESPMYDNSTLKAFGQLHCAFAIAVAKVVL